MVSKQTKIWLGGCGGCLLVVILIVLGLIIWGYSAYDSFAKESNKSVNSIFSGKSPSDYMLWAFDLSQFSKESTPSETLTNVRFVVGINPNQSSFLGVIDGNRVQGSPVITCDDFKHARVLSEKIKNELDVVFKNSSEKRTSSKFEPIGDGSFTLPTNGHSKYPLVYYRVTSNSGRSALAAATLFDYPGQRQVILADLVSQKDLSEDEIFQNLSSELAHILEESNLLQGWQESCK
jgi:hypothetical protein